MAYLLDALAPLGGVSVRKMFGGYGVYAETQVGKKMFALVADSELYLKADVQNQGEFEVLGLAPFAYEKGGKTVRMSYFQAPPDAVESPSDLLPWAQSALAAAERAA